MATQSSPEAQAAVALAMAHKAEQNRRAAQIATAAAVYYQRATSPESESAIERWLALIIPRLIESSDAGARQAATYFDRARRLELGVNAPRYDAQPALGAINDGVRQSLLTVGPYAYQNKARVIRESDLSPGEQRTLLAAAKAETGRKVAAATVRHAQAGSRQTIFANAGRDRTALGWIRVTRAKPCAFCAMLASRGIQYRAFREDSFAESNLNFTGVGEAKVHDECQCSMKAVYVKDDPILAQNQTFMDLWERWGAGGRGNVSAALRFRRGYDHWLRTGEYLDWDVVDAA